MSDAIKKLHDYLAKSPSVIYPEDVLAYLPAIEAENAQLREQGERLFDKTLELATENARLRNLLDYVLPIAMYAASTEEGDRIRELMREVGA